MCYSWCIPDRWRYRCLELRTRRKHENSSINDGLLWYDDINQPILSNEFTFPISNISNNHIISSIRSSSSNSIHLVCWRCIEDDSAKLQCFIGGSRQITIAVQRFVVVGPYSDSEECLPIFESRCNLNYKFIKLFV